LPALTLRLLDLTALNGGLLGSQVFGGSGTRQQLGGPPRSPSGDSLLPDVDESSEDEDSEDEGASSEAEEETALETGAYPPDSTAAYRVEAMRCAHEVLSQTIKIECWVKVRRGPTRRTPPQHTARRPRGVRT